jgi:predicted nucleic acid-binding protein
VIIDTNALSAWRDGDGDLLRAIAASRLILTVITLGEYRYGITRSRRRADAEAWLDHVTHSVRVAPVNVDTTRHYATVRSMLRDKGRPISRGTGTSMQSMALSAYRGRYISHASYR